MKVRVVGSFGARSLSEALGTHNNATQILTYTLLVEISQPFFVACMEHNKPSMRSIVLRMRFPRIKNETREL